MVKGKRGQVERGLWIIIAFVLLFAIALIIIYMAQRGPENIKAVLEAISNIFG